MRLVMLMNVSNDDLKKIKIFRCDVLLKYCQIVTMFYESHSYCGLFQRKKSALTTVQTNKETAYAVTSSVHIVWQARPKGNQLLDSSRTSEWWPARGQQRSSSGFSMHSFILFGPKRKKKKISVPATPGLHQQCLAVRRFEDELCCSFNEHNEMGCYLTSTASDAGRDECFLYTFHFFFFCLQLMLTKCTNFSQNAETGHDTPKF